MSESLTTQVVLWERIEEGVKLYSYFKIIRSSFHFSK